MKTEKKKYLMRTTMLLLLMMFTGISAWAEDVLEKEVNSWDELKSNAATVTTENGVTTVKLNSCVKIKSYELIVNETVILDLNGYGIRTTSGMYSPVVIGSTGNLTLRDDATVKPTRYISINNDHRGSAVSSSVPGGNYLTVEGGYITGSYQEYGIKNDGKFTMEGGTVCGNNWGGVYSSGTFRMTGGSITGNYGDKERGHGVYILSGTFIMEGGSITGNTAPNNGGGVFVEDGTCFIVGGTVSGNTAGSGKGNNVYSLSANVYIISDCVSDGIDADEDSHIPTQSSFGNGDGSDTKPFVISDAAGWNIFCQLIVNNIFSDKHYELGGNISVTTMAGGIGGKKYFAGIFDGKGYSLEFNATTTEDNIAPFREVAGATIRNLHVTGTITTSSRDAAGIVADVVYPGLTIENCRSSVIIHSTKEGVGYHGGILAGVVSGSSGSPTVNITGCVFDGKITTGSTDATKTTDCGGFVGRNRGTVNLTDCIYDPAALADGEKWASTGSKTFVYNYTNTSSTSSGTANFTRCYYKRSFGNIQGKQRCRITAGENVTLALSGTATEYDVSGITSYADNQGLKYESTYYAGENDAVKLTLGHTDREGYEFHDYTASAGILDDSATPSTLTMPAANVTITAVWEPLNNISLNASLIDGLYWTTFYCGDAGYRIADDENACAYTATFGDDVITLHLLGKMIPKETAVIIAGDDNSISMTRDDVSAAEYSVKNDLHGVDVPTARTTLTSDDTKTLYMLSNKNNHFGFHQYGGTNVPARKAYFTVSSSANASLFNIVFDDDASAIKSVNGEEFTVNGSVYDLQGRKVENPKKGLYIVNGKKVVIK